MWRSTEVVRILERLNEMDETLEKGRERERESRNPKEITEDDLCLEMPWTEQKPYRDGENHGKTLGNPRKNDRNPRCSRQNQLVAKTFDSPHKLRNSGLNAERYGNCRNLT